MFFFHFLDVHLGVVNMTENIKLSIIVKEESKNDNSDCEEDCKDSEAKQCSFCNFTAPNVRDIRKHKKECHYDKLPIIHCDQCSFVTHWKDSLKLHKKYHELPAEWSNVKCDHCDYIYSFDPKVAE